MNNTDYWDILLFLKIRWFNIILLVGLSVSTTAFSMPTSQPKEEGFRHHLWEVYIKKTQQRAKNLKDENSYGGQWIEFKGGNKLSQSEGASIKYVYKNED